MTRSIRVLRVTGFNLHCVYGSPSYDPEMQLHKGLWLTTLHNALTPHLPTHGSIQRSFWQALLLGHSESITHSGRQFGGRPM